MEAHNNTYMKDAFKVAFWQKCLKTPQQFFCSARILYPAMRRLFSIISFINQVNLSYFQRFGVIALIVVTAFFRNVSSDDDINHRYHRQNGESSYKFYLEENGPTKSSKRLIESANNAPSSDGTWNPYWQQRLKINKIENENQAQENLNGHDSTKTNEQFSHPAHHAGEMVLLEKRHSLKDGEEDFAKDQRNEMLNTFEQLLENLSEPGMLIPVINNVTLIALLILHLPAIVPAVLIPLTFFAVGTLLIPIVRVNYFINHKDDGEDGRSLSLGLTTF